ncbi:MAG: hypothetical protein LN409_03090 [Candidatus Thermoplasmatota archaeon]|nr:hypothetical protein [Candidatus Thermoplasmatota archaeon]
MAFTLSFLDPIVGFLTEFGPWLVAIILLIVVWMYGLAWLTRYFEYLKMHESKYLDNRALDIIKSVVQWIWVGILGVLVLVIVYLQSGEEGFLLVLRKVEGKLLEQEKE